MSTYSMSDGTIVKTENATHSWDEARYFDGRNMISVNTGSQWHHERLYRSRKGRYYIVRWSNYQGSQDSAEWISREEAVRWLLLNKEDLHEELESLRDKVEE